MNIKLTIEIGQNERKFADDDSYIFTLRKMQLTLLTMTPAEMRRNYYP